MKWLEGITDSMDMNLSKHWEIMKDKGTWQATVYRVTRVRHNLATEQQQLTLQCSVSFCCMTV